MFYTTVQDYSYKFIFHIYICKNTVHVHVAYMCVQVASSSQARASTSSQGTSSLSQSQTQPSQAERFAATMDPEEMAKKVSSSSAVVFCFVNLTVAVTLPASASP